jgi:hypothetical protein
MMRRVGALLSLALVLGFVYFGLTYIFGAWERDSSDAHGEARREFMAALPESDCLVADEISDVAEEWGWETREETGFGWCVAPVGVARWLRVTVEPALPFSTADENAAFLLLMPPAALCRGAMAQAQGRLALTELGFSRRENPTRCRPAPRFLKYLWHSKRAICALE